MLFGTGSQLLPHDSSLRHDPSDVALDPNVWFASDLWPSDSVIKKSLMLNLQPQTPLSILAKERMKVVTK